MEILIVDNPSKLANYAATFIAARVNQAERLVLGLATGSTPVNTYRELSALYRSGKLDFSKVVSINLDEYVGLSAEDKQSYRQFMNENLFNHVNINLANTHIFNGKAEDFAQECARYDSLIVEKGGIDLQLLGIGMNGHIGFNEPDDYFSMTSHVVDLSTETILSNAPYFESVDQMPKQALTMGIGQIFKAKTILLLATGESKSAVITSALLGPVTPRCPASILQLHQDVTILLDCEAARGILGAKGVYYKEIH